MELEEFKIDEDVKQVLLGSLLGDGSLKICKGGKNAYYYELHGLKQKEYLIWKDQFLNIFNTKFYQYSTYDKRTCKTYDSILIWSKVNPILTDYHKVLYKNRRKNITKKFLNEFNVLGLAIWYMDDGYYHYGDGRCGFGTDSFNYSEHIIIKNWLKKRFGIDSQIHKRTKNNSFCYTIILPKIQADKFLKMIKSFVVPSLYYKLGHLNGKNYSKIKLHNDKVIEYRKLEYQRNKDKYIEHNHAYYKK
ncbi:hypothetical protein HYY71_02400 [Candidatus Woesearchaeota archaeon]|nr:hypothetical protein [Candidatus Woesearchaeota archaeon]